MPFTMALSFTIWERPGFALIISILFIPCRYIKLSSPNLNNVILLGGILMYITVFLYGFDGRLSPLSYTYVCRVSIVKLAEYRE